MNNNELYIIAKTNKIQLNHVLMMDEVVKLPRGDVNVILNLEDTGESGSHWVAFIIKGNNAFYCDSFGGMPPKILQEFCKNRKLHLGYNFYICQSLKSIQCGLYSLQCIKYLQHIPAELLFEIANNYINSYEPLLENRNEKIVRHGLLGLNQLFKK